MTYERISTGERITVRKGKCWNGLPVNTYTEAQLAAIDLRLPAPAPPYVPSLDERIEQMNAAWKQKVEADWHWSAAPLVHANGKANKPKAKQALDWTKGLYATYLLRKQGLLTNQIQWSDALLEFDDCPTTPLEVFLEDEA